MDDEIRQRAVEAFRRAHRAAGGHSALARICGCSAPNIQQLIVRGSLLPGQYVLEVERETGVSRHDLRPDLYPREDEPPAPAAEKSPRSVAGTSSLEQVH